MDSTEHDADERESLRGALASLPGFEDEPQAAGSSEQAGPEQATVQETIQQTPADEAIADVPAAEDAPQDEMPAFPEVSTDASGEGPAEEGPDPIDAIGADEVAPPSDDAPAFSQIGADQGVSTFQVSVEPVRKSSKVLRNILLALVILAMLVGVAYCAVAYYFTSHFLPNTTVNGEDVSLSSVADLSARVTAIGDAWTIRVAGDGIDVTISAPEIDFVYDGEAYAAKAQEQIPSWTWIAEISDRHEYTVSQGITYDETKLDTILNNHVAVHNKDATDPVNATMAFDGENHVFVPVSESLGTKVELQAVLDLVNQAVSTMQTEAELTDEQLVQPTITTDDDKIIQAIEKANGLLSSNFTMRIAGVDVMGIDRDLMASWISLNDARDFTVDVERIKAWTQGDLSSFLDTIGTKRTYTRPDGKVCEVEGGTGNSAYGWLLDGEALANVLAERLQQSNAEPLEIPMKKSAVNWAPGGQEWGARYIDVDLSEQHVRMYDDAANLIWETDCVSGNPIYGGGTDTGVYYIYDKESPTVLVGLDYDHDGQPDYRTDVTYWMPFDGGEGLHDAGWRSYFGSNIYTYDGSHGCVNLPYYAAQELYGITNVGDVVVVHW